MYEDQTVGLQAVQISGFAVDVGPGLAMVTLISSSLSWLAVN